MWRHVGRYSRWLRGRHAKAPLLFDPDWYCARYPDVAAEGMDPWRHYVLHGAAEGRDPNPLFDTDWYLSRYADVAAAGLNPLQHYCQRGAEQGHEPNAFFDSDWYAQENPRAARTAFSPLLHYLREGAEARRDPSPRFDTAWYLRANPELQPGPLTPLGDYLQYGRLEGRSAVPIEAPAVVAKPDLGRIAVYTAIVGDYDCLKIPAVLDPRCDYFCFTDRDISWQNIWIGRKLDWRHEDPTRMARYVKLHASRYFPEYERSVWLDANLQLACAAQALMPTSDDWDIALWPHPYRDCTYAEGETCVRERKDAPVLIEAQMQRYRGAGFPQHAGLNETSVMVQRHNAPDWVRFAEAWWAEICRGSRRDQLSFAFAARHASPRIAHLGPRGNNMRNDPRLRYFAHTHTRARW